VRQKGIREEKIGKVGEEKVKNKEMSLR